MDRGNRREARVRRRGPVDAGTLPGKEESRRGARRAQPDTPDAVVVDVAQPERRLARVPNPLLRPAGIAEIVGVLEPVGDDVRLDRAHARSARRRGAHTEEDQLPVDVARRGVDAEMVPQGDGVGGNVCQLRADRAAVGHSPEQCRSRTARRQAPRLCPDCVRDQCADEHHGPSPPPL